MKSQVWEDGVLGSSKAISFVGFGPTAKFGRVYSTVTGLV